MPWLALAMAVAGAVKATTVDAAKEERQKKLAAETQKYSPWTGLKAGSIDYADPFGSALQGGMTGLQLQQGLDNSKAYQSAMAGNQAASFSPSNANKYGLGIDLGMTPNRAPSGWQY